MLTLSKPNLFYLKMFQIHIYRCDILFACSLVCMFFAYIFGGKKNFNANHLQ
jgi:hypothetical protein